jgi:hypothetical protein
VLLVLGLPAVAVVGLMVLTGSGQGRRGGGTAIVLLAAVSFPVTWLAWYVVDRRRLTRHDAQNPSGTPSTL